MSVRRSVLRGLASLAALGVLSGAVAAQAPGVKPAAMVNGEPIPLSDVQTILKQQPPSPTPLPAAQKRELELSALNGLIDDLLMKQYLRKNAKPADPKEVDTEVKELEMALKTGKNKMTLKEFLDSSGQTEAQLRADLATRVQWKAFILPRLPDNVVKAYYDANKLFFDKVFVRASHILIKLPPTASAAERQAAHAKLAALRVEIVAGKLDFAKAAKENSDCPSKENGGDIGPFPFKFAVVEPFARAAFATKVGDVTDVVTTEFGLHLIKVTDRNEGQKSNYEQIKDQVREVYAQEIYQNIISDMRKNSRIETNLP